MFISNLCTASHSNFIMLRNPGVPTIEEDLLAALCKANAFPKEMENDLGKVSEGDVYKRMKSCTFFLYSALLSALCSDR